MTPQEQARPARTRQVNPEAYEAYLRGRYYWNQRTCTKIKKGLQYFESARDQEPGWALSYVGIADSNISIALYCPTPPGPLMLVARAATLRALKIDDSLAEAHASLAMLYRYEWNWEALARELMRAIELNPNYAPAHQWYALYLSSQERHEEAVAEINRALELDPLAPILSGAKALVLFNAHHYRETIELCQKAIDFDPNWPWFHFFLGAASVESGAFDRGLAELDVAYELFPQRTLLLAGLGHAYARAGKRDEALKILSELKEVSKHSYVSSFDIGLVYMGLARRKRLWHRLRRPTRSAAAITCSGSTTFPGLPTCALIRVSKTSCGASACRNEPGLRL